MKKIIGIILSSIIALAAVFPVYAQLTVIGKVLTTDIVAFIDEQPIESFNIGNRTYIVAEDLSGYGFDVVWNAAERSLSINKNPNAKRAFLPVEKINTKKSEIIPLQFLCNVYATDIKTYMDSERIEACNVDGKTMIRIDLLSKYGYCDYDDKTRTVKIGIIKKDLDDACEHSEKAQLSLPCDNEAGKITYSGDVSDGKPNGFGRKTEHYEYTGPQYIEEYVHTGGFKDGNFHGYVYTEGHKEILTGSDRRERNYFHIHSYNNGLLDGYVLKQELSADLTRNEYIFENDKMIWKRQGKLDPDYIYGYYIEDDGYLDVLGNTIDYEQIQTPKIVSVKADSGSSFAIDEQNNVYAWGDLSLLGLKNRCVPVLFKKDIATIAPQLNFAPIILCTNGNIYYADTTLVNDYDNPLATDVKQISDGVYLDNEGVLWQQFNQLEPKYPPKKIDDNVKSFSSTYGRLLYIKNDGSVWMARNNYMDGSSWNDGYDLSVPRKVMDDAKYVYSSTGYFVVKNDNTLWTWTSDYYKSNYDDNSSQPQKIADDAEMVEAGNGGFIYYLKTDGSLWVMPDERYAEVTPLFESLTHAVKLMDDVKTFSCGWVHVLIVKNDGSLWAWGSNESGRLGDGTLETRETPVEIKNFYAPIKK